MSEQKVPFDIKMSLPMTPADWGKPFDIALSIHLPKPLPNAQGTIILTAPPTSWIQKAPFRLLCLVGGVIAFTLPGITIAQGATSLDLEMTGIEWDPSTIASLTLLSLSKTAL